MVKIISNKQVARIAGFAYLIIILAGIFAEFFVRGNLIVAGDAAATVTNILANESLFRVGFVSDFVMVICDAFVGVLLYILLKQVSKGLALLALAFRLIHTAILGINLLNHFYPILLLNGTEYLTSFSADQLHALVLLFLEAHKYGYEIGLLFFGLHCLVLGYLIIRSGFFPKILGVLMMLAGPGYLIECIVLFLFPGYEAVSYPGLAFAGIAELSFCLWLIIKAVKAPIDYLN